VRGSSFTRLAAWMLFCICLSPRTAPGATLEGLLMPGPLSNAHAKLEADCGNCHDRKDRSRQRELCLGCHKDVASDLRDRRGFHGRRSEIATAQCSACHSDHKGRSARIVSPPGPGFDHERTDFKLDGAHRQVACANCHASGKPLRAAPSGCVDCHKKQEPHEGKLGNDCATCHDTRSWNNVRFDHGKTRFALQARHAELPCAACHAGNRWRQTPMACASCHAPDDVHRGERGNDCANCHTQSTWSDARFDHGKETGFELKGAHAKADCQSCHRSGRFQDELPKDCAGCHRAIDAHAGRMGRACGDCHGVEQWKVPAFEHERKARFALTGAHAGLGCHSCHIVPVSEAKPPRQCEGCHRPDDVHAGTVSRDCATCHGTANWRQTPKFDHDLTSFALLGQHATVPCANCHVTARFGDARRECAACHRADDVHRGSLGEDCAGCHHPNGWNQWQFDHAKQSGFALTGAHARVQCGSCHQRPPAEAKLARNCVACHSDDDVHLGQFGRRCESCHSTISFRLARPQ
jgi:hypothetical protein